MLILPGFVWPAEIDGNKEAVVAVVVAATQITGPRPTLGPPLEEGGMGAVATLDAPVGDPPD